MSKNTSWGSVADWYDASINDADSYQARVILPNVLRLLAPEKGRKILDLACGQGYFSHALSARGASVVGVDIAPELVNLAKKHAGHTEEFYVAEAHDLSKFDKNRFDSVLCVLAIQNIDRMTDVFEEVSRLLKTEGKFVIVLNHPAFRIPGESSWQFDEKLKVQYRRIDEYISESKKTIDMHPGQAKKNTTISFHRPIQTYSKSLANAGFAISRIEEWMSHRESEKGPRKTAEDNARREIPLFMCLECVKL
ncbi:MAG: methyltransferase domain-containing protein [bacterium]|nr:methyltransferase domain-containing protein [bacterium]